MHFSKVPTESDVADHVFKKHCYGTEKPRGLKSVGKPGWENGHRLGAELVLWPSVPWNVSPPPLFSVSLVALTFLPCGSPCPLNNQGAWVGSEASGMSGVCAANSFRGALLGCSVSQFPRLGWS